MDVLIFWVEFVNHLFSVPWIVVHLYGHLANNICNFTIGKKLDFISFDCLNDSMHTSSMIGHHQEAVVVDVEGLPVQGRMCLQSLVMQETTLLNIPLIDHGQFRLHLPRIRHHHEDLNKKSVMRHFHRNC